MEYMEGIIEVLGRARRVGTGYRTIWTIWTIWIRARARESFKHPPYPPFYVNRFGLLGLDVRNVGIGNPSVPPNLLDVKELGCRSVGSVGILHTQAVLVW
jgi:hypothetical protein